MARNGRKPWAELLAPAVELATEGPVVDWCTTLMIATAQADLAKDPASAARFLRGGQAPVGPAANMGKALRLPTKALAATLATLAEEGAPALYRGRLAESIASDVKAMGGYLSTEDLADYRVRTVEPLQIAYGDHRIHVLPELNGGPTLHVAFGALSKIVRSKGASPQGSDYVAYAHAMRAAWEDRFKRLGDAGERSAPTCTTHLTVIDREGNIAVLTQTLLSLFGSRVTLPGTGILMNNGVNWFDPRPGGPNAIAPDRRVLANYVPSVMTGPDGVMAVGGCGGRKIIPAVFQLLAMRADFGCDLDTLFETPRVDVSGGPEVVTDRRMAPEALAALDASFDTILAEPVVYSNPYTLANGVLRVGDSNEAACEPLQPWARPSPRTRFDGHDHADGGGDSRSAGRRRPVPRAQRRSSGGHRGATAPPWPAGGCDLRAGILGSRGRLFQVSLRDHARRAGGLPRPFGRVHLRRAAPSQGRGAGDDLAVRPQPRHRLAPAGRQAGRGAHYRDRQRHGLACGDGGGLPPAAACGGRDERRRHQDLHRILRRRGRDRRGLGRGRGAQCGGQALARDAGEGAGGGLDSGRWPLREQSLYVLGRGPALAIAAEAALKLKETCSLHAEAFSPAEVMHGPLELVEPGFPVLALAPDDVAAATTRFALDKLAASGRAALQRISHRHAGHSAEGHLDRPWPRRSDRAGAVLLCAGRARGPRTRAGSGPAGAPAQGHADRLSPGSALLQGLPHLDVALCCPNPRMIDAGRLVEGAADVERKAMLIDRVIAEGAVHRGPDRSEGSLEIAA